MNKYHVLKGFKTCKDCKTSKELNEFKKDNRNLNGCASVCRKCYSARHKGYYSRYYKRPEFIAKCQEKALNYYYQVKRLNYE